MPTILGAMEESLKEFRPKNGREYVALQIAKQFRDTQRLGRYLVVAKTHPKRVMLEAARIASLRRDLNRASPGDLFFEVLAEFDKGGSS